MNHPKKRIGIVSANVLALAVGGLVAGVTTGCKSADEGSAEEVMAQAKHACKAMNECAGHGGCASGDNGCAGKNSCKGQGGCATVAAPRL